MVKNSYSNLLNTMNEEEGSQLIEFIGILPLMLSVALIGWQIFWVGHTFIVTANAAREGARELAACEGRDVNGVVQRASRGYDPRILQASRGGSSTKVVVANPIPTIRIPKFLETQLPDIRMGATMRTEKCRP